MELKELIKKFEDFFLHQSEKNIELCTQFKDLSNQIEKTDKRFSRIIGWQIAIFCAFVGIMGLIGKCTYNTEVNSRVQAENLSFKVNTGTFGYYTARNDTDHNEIKKQVKILCRAIDTLQKKPAYINEIQKDIKEIKSRLNMRGLNIDTFYKYQPFKYAK
jgi:hypothetical protein